MVSLVASRKRKDAHNHLVTSQDKGKVRIVSRNSSYASSIKPLAARSSLPSSRTFSNLRRSIKIFSMFRSGKVYPPLYKQYSILTAQGSGLSSTPLTVERNASCPNTPGDKAQLDNPVRATSLQTQTVSPDEAIPDITISRPEPSSPQDASSMIHLPSAAGFDGSEPIMTEKERRPVALHTSWSTPSLSQQPTRRMPSSLLQKATVIHRPNLSSRPTVLKGQDVSEHEKYDICHQLADTNTGSRSNNTKSQAKHVFSWAAP